MHSGGEEQRNDVDETITEGLIGFATSNCSTVSHDSRSFRRGEGKNKPSIAIRSNVIFGDSDSGSDSEEEEQQSMLAGRRLSAISDEEESDSDAAGRTQEQRERVDRKLDTSTECYSETPVVKHEHGNKNRKGRTAEQVKAEELKESRKSIPTDGLTKWIHEKQSSLVYKDMDELKKHALIEQESLADRLRAQVERESRSRSQAAKEELESLKLNLNGDKLKCLTEEKKLTPLNEAKATTGLLQSDEEPNEEPNENLSCDDEESDEDHTAKPENRYTTVDTETGGPSESSDTDEENDEFDSLVVIPPTTKQSLAFKKAHDGTEVITAYKYVNNKCKPVVNAAPSARLARGQLIGRLRTKCISQANTRWAKMLDSSYKDGKEMLHELKYAEMMRRERSEKDRQVRIARERQSAAHAKEFREAANSDEEELEFDDASPQTSNVSSVATGTVVEGVMEEQQPTSDSCKSVNSDEALNSSLSLSQSSPSRKSGLITADISVEPQEVVHESSSKDVLMMDDPASVVKPKPNEEVVVLFGMPPIEPSSSQPSPVSLDLKQRKYGRNRNRGQIGAPDGTQDGTQVAAVEGGGLDSTVTKINSAALPTVEASDIRQSGGVVQIETVKHSAEIQDVPSITNGSCGELREKNGLDDHNCNVSHIPENEDDAQPEISNGDRTRTLQTPSFFDRVKAAIDEGGENEKEDRNHNGSVAIGDVSAEGGAVVRKERNAGYRAMLAAERRKHTKMARIRKRTGNVIDEEAEEDEEESAVKGLGDFGFGVMTEGNKEVGDGGKEEENIDKATDADLEGIVDTYSDDEGDDAAAMSFRGREAAERDKSALRSVLRQVKEGFGEARLGGRSAVARGALRTDQLTAAARSSRKEAKRLGLLNSDEEWSENEEHDGRESEDDLDEHELAEMVEREQRLRHMGLSEIARDALNSSDESDADGDEEENEKGASMKDEMDIAEERMVKKWSQKAKVRRVLSELQDINNDGHKEGLLHSLDADGTSQDVLSALQCTNSNMGINGQGGVRGSNRHHSGTYHGGKLRDGELQVGCVNL